MNTRTHTTSTPSRQRKAYEASHATFRQPSYACRELPDAVSIVVYVPGVDASGVEIEAHFAQALCDALGAAGGIAEAGEKLASSLQILD